MTNSLEEAAELIPRKGASDDWKVLLPITYWLPKYSKQFLISDGLAAVTVALMSIPQCMALAGLAGLSEVNGLYVGMLAPCVYSVLGTSGQLQVTAIAITSIMSAEAVRSQLGEADLDSDDYSANFVALSAMIGFQVGAIQFVLGLLNVGLLANMLSHSVIVGFMAAASLIISFVAFFLSALHALSLISDF